MIPTCVIAAAAVAVLACGCGSKSPTAPSAASQPTPAQMTQDGIKFVQCLRSHGITNVPDPGPTSGREFKSAISSDAQSPAFQPAYNACQHLLGAGGTPPQSPAKTREQANAMLAFARCIRSHDFPSFPDPNTSGQFTHQMVTSAGINLHQPAVLHAADACVGVTHGFITKAVVARFVAGH